MKPAANLNTVEWQGTASRAGQAPTLEDLEPEASRFDDDRGSGVHARTRLALEPNLSQGVPDHVGPYRLIERIGSGAMGHVYRAEHTLLGRMVAIKMLRTELTNDEACVRRFLAEARAVNLIAHDHIIDVTDFASTPSGQPWFVMELLEGSDLACAATHAPLTLVRTLEITRQLCEALAAVHTAGIVHRDVKPDNVFLTQREGRDYVTLLDFGIARLPDPTSADPMQEGLMGTPYYMAPEQISASAIDHRADLYAVGSLLFELLAGIGNTPFHSSTLQKQLMDVLLVPAPKLSSQAQLPVAVRDDLDQLVARCLAKHATDRPASAREIATELKRIAAKLSAPALVAAEAPSDTPTLILRGPDAISTAPIEVVETQKRARRELRVRRAWSSRGAPVLSAVAAAAVMWVATSETSWAHALSRVTAWRDRAMTVEGVNIAQPASFVESSSFEATDSSAPTQVTGGVGATAALLVAAARTAEPHDGAARDLEVVAQPDADEVAAADSSVEREAAREERQARRAARAKARLEQMTIGQPALVITPVSEPVPQEPTYDRNLVLNPFSD